MKDKGKTKEQPVKEPDALRQRVRGLERSAAEQSRQAEAVSFSEAVFTSIQESVVATDTEYAITYWNTASERMYGIKASEAIGKKLLDVIEIVETSPGENGKRFKKLETRGHYQDELLHRTRCSELWVNVNVQAIKLNGKRYGWVALATDISERKQAEEALRESRRRFRDLANLLPQTVWETDDKGNFTFVNKEGFRSHGYTLQELEDPMNAAQVFVPEDRDRLAENAERIMRGEQPGGVEYTALRKDGSTFPVLIHATPIIRDGKPAGMRGVTIDISRLKQAEELYRTLANSSPVGVYIVQDGKFQFGNPQFQENTGYSENELLGTNPLKIVVPEDRNMVRENAVAMIKGKRSLPYEYRTLTKSGDIRWVLETVAPIQYHGRQATLGNYMDITERKKVEALLRESEEFNSSLLRNSPYPILVLTPDTSIEYVNPALERLTGFTSVELIGKKAPYPWLTKESLPRTIEEFQMAMRRGAQWFEELFEKKNGEQFWVEITSAPIRDNGDLKYYMASWVDITERKQIEDALRREKERAEGYLDIAGVTLATTDVLGNITLINRKGCEILGYEVGELIGSNWFNTLVPERLRSEIRGVFRKLLAGDIEPVRHYEYPLLAKNGEERLIAFNNTVIRDREGQIVGALLSGEDITELRKAQEQLQHSRLLASLGQMTAGIAHEVNNPLGSILLYAELLMASEVPSQIRKDLKVIHDEAKRAAKIMTDLLTYGRRTKSQMRRLNLHTPLKKVLEMRQYEQKVQNIAVSTSLENGPLYINGDSSQMMQVFMNLILNAEEALKESKGGNILVTTEAAGEWARVTITDDGIGIPPKNLNQVFYPFFTTKQVGEGTGLGLSTCYGVVTDHNGLIRAENNEKGGATFTVELPLPDRQKQESSGEKPRSQIVDSMTEMSKVGR